MRMFSESPIPKKKSAFFDFLKEAEKADEEAAETPVEQAQQEKMEIEFETSQEGIKSDVAPVEEISQE